MEFEKVKNENYDKQRIKNNLVFSTIIGCSHHIVMFVKEVHPSNTLYAISSTEFGIIISLIVS